MKDTKRKLKESLKKLDLHHKKVHILENPHEVHLESLELQDKLLQKQNEEYQKKLLKTTLLFLLLTAILIIFLTMPVLFTVIWCI